jgi:diacylglycerol kinase
VHWPVNWFLPLEFVEPLLLVPALVLVLVLELLLPPPQAAVTKIPIPIQHPSARM